MRKSAFRFGSVLILICIGSFSGKGQGFSFNCTRDTTINLCNVTQCLSLQAIIPDIRSLTTSYTVNPTSTVPGCFPVYTQPNDAGTSISIPSDDRYSDTLQLSFRFPFYEGIYTKLVASTNGYLSFDTLRARQTSHFAMLLNGGSLDANNGTPLDLPSARYDKRVIMGPYHDINPALSTSPTQRIQYTELGTAPHRRWVLSFYKVPLYNCTSLIENTHQIVLYESTGIIEVIVFSKQVCNSWNQGRAMIGIQNTDATEGLMVPGRRASDPPWGGLNINESYRFVPSGGSSLFKRVELYDLAGTLITTGTTAAAGPGQLRASFPNICPPAGTTTYVVKSVYQKFDDPAVEIFGTDTVRVNRTSGTELNATTAMTPSACGPNGSVSVAIPNGVGIAPFSYVLDNGTPVNTNDRSYTFSGLSAGNHTVVVTDAAGCSSSRVVNVTVSNVLAVTATPAPVTCNGASNGSITITPQNGTGPFQYSLDNANWQASNVFSGLAPGSYFIYVKDNSGCQISNHPPVVVANGPAITATAAITPPACPGTSSGSITMTPSPTATGPVLYSFNGGAFQANNVFSNLPAGNYFISVRDAVGCFVNNIILAVPAGTGSLTANLVPTGTSCAGANNGSISITPTSGSAPYQYSVNGGTFQTGTSITNLAAGNYSIVVKDNTGCTSNPYPVTISQGSALLANAVPSNASCSGVNNGQIVVTPTNGSGPYTYTLDGGAPQSDNTFLNVSAGNHTVVVTDGAGCVSSPIAVAVNVNAAITGSAITTPTSCTGASNGSTTITPANGVSPFEYSLNGGNFQTSNVFTGLPAGNHGVVIKDGVGCTSGAIPIVVTVGPALQATASSVPTTCTGASNGVINVVPQNGIAPHTYSLNGGTFQSASSFGGLAPGIYSVVMKDAAGCATNPISVEVVQGPPLTPVITPINVSCNGGNNGGVTISFAVVPGQPVQYSYSLDNQAFQAANNFTGLTAGNYTAYFKEALNGCSGSQNFTVTQPQALAATSTKRAVSCNGLSDGLIRLTPAGGTAPYEYSLDGVAYQVRDSFLVPAGIYTVYIRDAKGCSFTVSNIDITEPAVLTGSVTATNASCDGGNDGLVVATVAGGTASYTYSIDGSSYQPSNQFYTAPGDF
ncbi:MAG TPA: SprB repeat-containing protein, partial [Flavisolibacter sp.]|nr:SprB repeat-containing protein [Flavisolibacter sp.]